jgi:hypothetical protein
MPSYSRKKKNKSKNNKTKKKQPTKALNQTSEFFEIFFELNKAFIPSTRTGQINYKTLFQRNTYNKVKLIPTKFLRFWETSQESATVSEQEIAQKFVEFMEELRPNQVDGFEPQIMIDQTRFKIDGTPMIKLIYKTRWRNLHMQTLGFESIINSSRIGH